MKLFSSNRKINPVCSFARARIYAGVIFISLPIFFAVLLLMEAQAANSAEFRGRDYLGAILGGNLVVWTLLASLAALAAAAFGTAWTITLGWRADRRQATELKRRIEQLEQQIAGGGSEIGTRISS